MQHASLFTGIGGFDLAAEWMGWENVFQVEKNKFCRKVLTKNFPNVKKYEDIKQFKSTQYRGQVDIITGGFPCQPFSNAGNRKGKDDDRYLWPSMLRVIREIKPSYVVGENVSGLYNMDNGKTFDQILASLEDEGYTVESFAIPACSVGAWHRRERIWIIAYTNQSDGVGTSGFDEKTSKEKRIQKQYGMQQPIISTGVPSRKIPSHYNQKRTQGVESQTIQGVETLSRFQNVRRFENLDQRSNVPEPLIRGGSNGIPNRVDRTSAIGNAIVPQVAYEIFKAIQTIENQ